MVNLSSTLNTISVNQDGGDDGEVMQAATPIILAASNILNVSSNVRNKIVEIQSCALFYPQFSLTRYIFPQKKVSEFVLSGMNNVQSALLNNKELNGEPAIIDSGQISVYVNR